MITPSMTLVTMPVGEVITKSKIWRPGVKLAVFAAVIDIVISPFALPVTVDVMVLYDVE
jgi:hypothetical protein